MLSLQWVISEKHPNLNIHLSGAIVDAAGKARLARFAFQQSHQTIRIKTGVCPLFF
jgi:hypothetical protein